MHQCYVTASPDPLKAALAGWVPPKRTLESALKTGHPPARQGGRYRMRTICLSNNAAERALRGIAIGRKAWLFAGSDRGGQRAAFMYSMIMTAKLNDIDPQAWLADVLARIADLPQTRLHELLPWNSRRQSLTLKAA